MNLEANARVRAGRYPGYYPCSHLGTITEVLTPSTSRGTIKYRILFDKPLPYETKPRREEVVAGMHRGYQLVHAVEAPRAAADAAEEDAETTMAFLGLNQDSEDDTDTESSNAETPAPTPATTPATTPAPTPAAPPIALSVPPIEEEEEPTSSRQVLEVPVDDEMREMIINVPITPVATSNVSIAPVVTSNVINVDYLTYNFKSVTLKKICSNLKIDSRGRMLERAQRICAYLQQYPTHPWVPPAPDKGRNARTTVVAAPLPPPHVEAEPTALDMTLTTTEARLVALVNSALLS